MVNMVNDGSSQRVVFTLTEKSITTAAGYTFTFTHVTSQEVVTFDLAIASDLSTNTSRFNMFDLGSYFNAKEPGQWKYKVIDKDTTKVLETGSMTLTGRALTVTGHTISITVNGYNGE